jgi:hypothetical protein
MTEERDDAGLESEPLDDLEVDEGDADAVRGGGGGGNKNPGDPGDPKPKTWDVI